MIPEIYIPTSTWPHTYSYGKVTCNQYRGLDMNSMGFQFLRSQFSPKGTASLPRPPGWRGPTCSGATSGPTSQTEQRRWNRVGKGKRKVANREAAGWIFVAASCRVALALRWQFPPPVGCGGGSSIKWDGVTDLTSAQPRGEEAGGPRGGRRQVPGARGSQRYDSPAVVCGERAHVRARSL
jgi:hypothetical protein